MAKDLADFQNPKGYWSHKGGFVVELVPGTPTTNVPTNVSVQGNRVTVHDGEVTQGMGGISMRSGGRDFYWGYKFLETIRTTDGSLLWKNNKLH